MPHFGHVPGPGCCTSGWTGQVYAGMTTVLAVPGEVLTYRPGAASNLARHAALQN
nr:hypothetical protein [Nannocystis exedens]